MKKIRETKIGEKGEVLSFIRFNKSKFRKWMSALIAFAFLFNVCSPSWARVGNYGDSDTQDAFWGGALAGLITDIFILISGGWSSLASTGAGTIAGVYAYYESYEDYGETATLFGWELECEDCFGIDGFDITITKGELTAMTAAVVAGVAAGLASSASSAGKTAASEASSAAVRTTTTTTAYEIIVGDIIQKFIVDWTTAFVRHAFVKGMTEWLQSEEAFFVKKWGWKPIEDKIIAQTVASAFGSVVGYYTNKAINSLVGGITGLTMTRLGKAISKEKKRLLDRVADSGSTKVAVQQADGSTKNVQLKQLASAKDMGGGKFELKDGTVVVVKGGGTSGNILKSVQAYKSDAVAVQGILKYRGDVARGATGLARAFMSSIAEAATLLLMDYSSYTGHRRDQRRDNAKARALARAVGGFVGGAFVPGQADDGMGYGNYLVKTLLESGAGYAADVWMADYIYKHNLGPQAAWGLQGVVFAAQGAVVGGVLDWAFRQKRSEDETKPSYRGSLLRSIGEDFNRMFIEAAMQVGLSATPRTAGFGAGDLSMRAQIGNVQKWIGRVTTMSKGVTYTQAVAMEAGQALTAQGRQSFVQSATYSAARVFHLLPEEHIQYVQFLPMHKAQEQKRSLMEKEKKKYADRQKAWESLPEDIREDLVKADQLRKEGKEGEAKALERKAATRLEEFARTTGSKESRAKVYQEVRVAEEQAAILALQEEVAGASEEEKKEVLEAALGRLDSNVRDGVVDRLGIKKDKDGKAEVTAGSATTLQSQSDAIAGTKNISEARVDLAKQIKDKKDRMGALVAFQEAFDDAQRHYAQRTGESTAIVWGRDGKMSEAQTKRSKLEGEKSRLEGEQSSLEGKIAELKQRKKAFGEGIEVDDETELAIAYRDMDEVNRNLTFAEGDLEEAKAEYEKVKKEEVPVSDKRMLKAIVALEGAAAAVETFKGMRDDAIDEVSYFSQGLSEEAQERAGQRADEGTATLEGKEIELVRVERKTATVENVLSLGLADIGPATAEYERLKAEGVPANDDRMAILKAAIRLGATEGTLEGAGSWLNDLYDARDSLSNARNDEIQQISKGLDIQIAGLDGQKTALQGKIDAFEGQFDSIDRSMSTLEGTQGGYELVAREFVPMVMDANVRVAELGSQIADSRKLGGIMKASAWIPFIGAITMTAANVGYARAHKDLDIGTPVEMQDVLYGGIVDYQVQTIKPPDTTAVTLDDSQKELLFEFGEQKLKDKEWAEGKVKDWKRAVEKGTSPATAVALTRKESDELLGLVKESKELTGYQKANWARAVDKSLVQRQASALDATGQAALTEFGRTHAAWSPEKKDMFVEAVEEGTTQYEKKVYSSYVGSVKQPTETFVTPTMATISVSDIRKQLGSRASQLPEGKDAISGLIKLTQDDIKASKDKGDQERATRLQGQLDLLTYFQKEDVTEVPIRGGQMQLEAITYHDTYGMATKTQTYGTGFDATSGEFETALKDMEIEHIQGPIGEALTVTTDYTQIRTPDAVFAPIPEVKEPAVGDIKAAAPMRPAAIQESTRTGLSIAGPRRTSAQADTGAVTEDVPGITYIGPNVSYNVKLRSLDEPEITKTLYSFSVTDIRSGRGLEPGAYLKVDNQYMSKLQGGGFAAFDSRVRDAFELDTGERKGLAEGIDEKLKSEFDEEKTKKMMREFGKAMGKSWEKTGSELATIARERDKVGIEHGDKGRELDRALEVGDTDKVAKLEPEVANLEKQHNALQDQLMSRASQLSPDRDSALRLVFIADSMAQREEEGIQGIEMMGRVTQLAAEYAAAGTDAAKENIISSSDTRMLEGLSDQTRQNVIASAAELSKREGREITASEMLGDAIKWAAGAIEDSNAQKASQITTDIFESINSAGSLSEGLNGITPAQLESYVSSVGGDPAVHNFSDANERKEFAYRTFIRPNLDRAYGEAMIGVAPDKAAFGSTVSDISSTTIVKNIKSFDMEAYTDYVGAPMPQVIDIKSVEHVDTGGIWTGERVRTLPTWSMTTGYTTAGDVSADSERFSVIRGYEYTPTGVKAIVDERVAAAEKSGVQARQDYWQSVDTGAAEGFAPPPDRAFVFEPGAREPRAIYRKETFIHNYEAINNILDTYSRGAGVSDTPLWTDEEKR